MPLEILLILVVGGIAGIALALHLAGLSRVPRFDAASARAAWLREFPDDAVLDAAPSRDGHAARIEAASGRGIVWRMGADSAARPVAGAQSAASKDGLILHMRDYDAPKVRLKLSQEEAQTWARWIKGDRP